MRLLIQRLLYQYPFLQDVHPNKFPLNTGCAGTYYPVLRESGTADIPLSSVTPLHDCLAGWCPSWFTPTHFL